MGCCGGVSGRDGFGWGGGGPKWAVWGTRGCLIGPGAGLLRCVAYTNKKSLVYTQSWCLQFFVFSWAVCVYTRLVFFCNKSWCLLKLRSLSHKTQKGIYTRTFLEIPLVSRSRCIFGCGSPWPTSAITGLVGQPATSRGAIDG